MRQADISQHLPRMWVSEGTKDLFRGNAAAEIFQNTILELLQDISGAKNLSDDTIVYGKNQTDCDRNQKHTLKRLDESGAKLIRGKCLFSVKKLRFYGHVFGETGITPNSVKIQAIINSALISDWSSVILEHDPVCCQIHARICHYHRTPKKFDKEIHNLEMGKTWAFNKVKETLTSSKVMSYYNPNKQTEILVDASPVGLGAILMQEGHPFCYVSKSLTETEQKYSDW